MNKKLLKLLFASTLLLAACGDADDTKTTEESETENEQETEEITQDAEEDESGEEEDYKDYSIQELDYSVPKSWTEKTTDTNLKYYYPEDGMLMVDYMDLDETLSNVETRESFLDGMASSLDAFELISESEITIQGTTAYQYNLDIEMSNEEFTNSLVIFDYKDGFFSLLMATRLHSDKDYSNAFEHILRSIDFTDETDKDAEEVTEASDGNEIVLGEPIDVGEYTLTVQNYSLSVDYEGNDALIIEYDWVNNSEDSTTPFMTFLLKGFQDGVETDDVIMVEGVDLSIGQKEVRPGGKIEGAHGVVGVSDPSKPLELELDELFSITSNPYIVEIDLSTLE